MWILVVFPAWCPLVRRLTFVFFEIQCFRCSNKCALYWSNYLPLKMIIKLQTLFIHPKMIFPKRRFDWTEISYFVKAQKCYFMKPSHIKDFGNWSLNDLSRKPKIRGSTPPPNDFGVPNNFEHKLLLWEQIFYWFTRFFGQKGKHTPIIKQPTRYNILFIWNLLRITNNPPNR